VARRGHLLTALARPGFRRLLGVRLAGQFGDGVFQASLAGVVLFNPQNQANAGDIAAGFAVLLVPYSLIGPFAGVLLDRWWRQRVLSRANLVRAAAVFGVAAEIGAGLHGELFFASALVIISISRFILSALSVALPHVLEPAEFVTGNAFSTTAGSVATTVGGAGAIGLKVLAGGSNHSYAVIAVCSAAPYLLAGWLAWGFARPALGPDEAERGSRQSIATIAHGLRSGARHVYEHKPALYALEAIGVHRLCYGVTTVCTLLLYRNYFHDEGVFRSGLTGLGQVVAAIAVGGGLAALITPTANRRIGYARWLALLLVGSALVQLGLGLPYRLPLILLAAVLLGFAAQGIKISVDTLVQRTISDDYRGRVFTLYDALFNLALVVSAGLTAAVLPDSGRSPASIVVIAVLYALTAAIYLPAAIRAAESDTSR
jgi:MFS family permease